jgi:hypothetical protein
LALPPPICYASVITDTGNNGASARESRSIRHGRAAKRAVAGWAGAGDTGMRAALLLAVLLAGCAHHAMTALEATAAADREVRRMLPRLDRSSRTIRAAEGDGDWHIYYESPADEESGGPIIVQVNKRTRRAAIVQMPQ